MQHIAAIECHAAETALCHHCGIQLNGLIKLQRDHRYIGVGCALRYADMQIWPYTFIWQWLLCFVIKEVDACGHRSNSRYPQQPVKRPVVYMQIQPFPLCSCRFTGDAAPVVLCRTQGDTSRAINGLSIDSEPLSHIFQPSHGFVRNAAIGPGSDIQREATVEAYVSDQGLE